MELIQGLRPPGILHLKILFYCILFSVSCIYIPPDGNFFAAWDILYIPIPLNWLHMAPDNLQKSPFFQLIRLLFLGFPQHFHMKTIQISSDLTKNSLVNPGILQTLREANSLC